MRIAFLLIFSSFSFSAPAVTLEMCVDRILEWKFSNQPALMGVEPLLATPRLLISPFKEPNAINPGWMILHDRQTHQPMGSLAIRSWGDIAHVPIYLDRIILGDQSRPRIIRRRHLRMGLATEAKFAALYYTFHIPGVEKVYARVVPENTASIRLHQKLGFKEIIKDIPQQLLLPPGFMPVRLVYFSLDREEFKKIEAQVNAQGPAFFVPRSEKGGQWIVKDAVGLRAFVEKFKSDLEPSIVEQLELVLLLQNPQNDAMNQALLENASNSFAFDLNVPEDPRAKAEYFKQKKEREAPFGDAQVLLSLSALEMPGEGEPADDLLDTAFEWEDSQMLGYQQMRMRGRAFRNGLAPFIQKRQGVSDRF